MSTLVPLVASQLTGCVAVRIVSPSAVEALLPPPGSGSKAARLAALVEAHDANQVVYPQSALLRPIGAGLTTLGNQANEIGQSAVDQQVDGPDTLPAAPRLTTATLARAVQSAEFTTRSRAQCSRAYGNVPYPLFTPAWIPLPLRPDLHHDPALESIACPIRERPSADQLRAGTGYFCLYAQLAVQPDDGHRPPAPMIFVVPGLLHSSDHRYVQEVGSILFSWGYSVALIDMRDHGGTFHGQPWLPSTLGILEGDDLVQAAEYVSRLRPRHGDPIGRFGIVGFSAGGLFAVHAVVADVQRRFTEGVLAVSPLLDMPGTLRRMGKVRPCFLLDLRCISRRATAYYFMDLIRMRMHSLGMPAGEKDVGAIGPDDYIEPRIVGFEGYAGLPDARKVETPENLARAVKASLGGASPMREDGSALAILSSLDDPVIGARGARIMREALTTVPAVGVYTPARGGHIALSVVSPKVTRVFMRTFFDRVPCAAEVPASKRLLEVR